MSSGERRPKDGERLYLLRDGSAPAELPRSGKLIIGSSAERSAYVVDGPDIEDVHCAIGRLKSGGWALKDLGAPSGTFVNGERVETTKIVDGDIVQIGQVELRVSRAAGEARPKAGRRRPSTGSEVGNPPNETALPKQIGGYEIQRLLGRGGMGDVYLATQTSLERSVALKILKPELARDAKFVDRFRKEARAAARLNHPNIVTAYDVGEDAGHHFLSMEYMAGGSIEAELASRGRLSAEETIAILRDAAKGLVYAESRKILHRDIKPENLMRGDGGTTKIADLGLAVQVEQESVEGQRGKVFGTPHFIAPEVLRGDAPDVRSDLYSLGTTAYRLLSGRNPFDGADAREIARAILNTDAPRLGDVAPGVPAALERFVHKLLSKEPSDRPASAIAAHEEIEALGSGAAGGAKTRILIGAVALAAIAGGAFLFLRKGEGGTDPSASGDARTASAAGGGSDVDGVGGAAEPATDGGGADGSDPDSPDRPDGGADDGDSSSPGANDGAAAAKAMERDAREALAGLASEQLSDEERISRLRDLATSFAGTDAANEASVDADALEAAATQLAAAEAQLNSDRKTALDALRSALNTGREGGAPTAALLRPFIDLETPPTLTGDAAFAAEREQMLNEVLEQAMTTARASLEDANRAKKAGDIEATAAALERTAAAATLLAEVERGQLLASVETEVVAGVLDTLRDEARTRLDDIGERAQEFTRQRLYRERVAVGRLLGGALKSDLAALALIESASKIDDAAKEVTDVELREQYAEVATGLRAADGAYSALIDGWNDPGWRKKTIREPRTGARIDVVGTAAGRALLLEADGGGAPSKIVLSSFSSDSTGLAELFQPKRLPRGWTAEEAKGIAYALAANATIEAVRSIGPALAKGNERFTDDDRERALAPFSELERWKCEDAAALAVLKKERDTVDTLIRALRARSDGMLGESAALLTRILAEDRATFVVMILSDGGKR